MSDEIRPRSFKAPGVQDAGLSITPTTGGVTIAHRGMEQDAVRPREDKGSCWAERVTTTWDYRTEQALEMGLLLLHAGGWSAREVEIAQAAVRADRKLHGRES